MNRHTTFQELPPLLQRDSDDHDDDDYNENKEELPCKRDISSVIWIYKIAVLFVTLQILCTRTYKIAYNVSMDLVQC